MNKEQEFLKIISNTLSNSSFLGDDCAYLDEYKLAVSKDCLIEDVHFSIQFMTPYEIAKKALLVNISDIFASGAIPKYVLIGLGGKLDNNFIKNFYSGIDETIKEYNIKIIGGDLFKADKITVSITILGDYKNRKISSRKNAKDGYIVAVSGEFGSSAKGLKELFEGIKESYFINYHKKPLLQKQMSEKIALYTNLPYAMMDSSDGLFDCLYKIAKESEIQIRVDYDKIPKKTLEKDFVLYGGEDYSLVICLSEEDYKNIKGLKQIGVCQSGEGVYIDNIKTEYRGFNHFE